MIEQLIDYKGLTGPLLSLTSLIKEANNIHKHISKYIPKAKILIAGSAAYYFHYDPNNKSMVMNDIDAALITDYKTLEYLFKESAKYKHKEIRPTCRVTAVGLMDLHFDLNQYEQDLYQFNTGTDLGNTNIRVTNKEETYLFYKKINRPKDQEKLRVMEKVIYKR